MVEENIPLASIDLSDSSYKISKNNLTDELAASVKTFGIIRRPIVFPYGDGFRILTGHNRVKAGQKAGFDAAPVLLCPGPDAGLIAGEAALKSFNREIGPAGKLKAAELLKNEFALSNPSILKIRAGLGIPEWFFQAGRLEKFRQLPAAVKDYFDEKDVPFSLIDTYMALPAEAAAFLARQISLFPVRINIFKKITEMLLDMAKRGERCSFAADPVEFSRELHGRGAELELFKKVFTARYPEYSAMKKRADEIAAELSGGGVQVDFPEFFEGGALSVKIAVKKRDGAEAVPLKAAGLRKELLQQLLDML